MATRINTKFVIPMIAALLLMGVGGYFLVTKFVFSSADEKARQAEKAMVQGQEALEAGDIETANSFFASAASNYNRAYRKDLTNTAYLYGTIDANESYICTQQTEAVNRLGMVFNASLLSHDATGATEDDQRQFYERMLERFRMGLRYQGSVPGTWLQWINKTARETVQADESNKLARRWRGISGVYLLRNDMPVEERAIARDDLTDALEQTPNDPLLLHHLAQWHYNEGRRLFDAAGREVTDAVSEQYALGVDYSTRAYEAAPDQPYNVLNHIKLLTNTPLDTEGVRERIGQVLLAFAERLATDAEARAGLFPAEVSLVVGWLTRYPGAQGYSGDPDEDQAIALAVRIGEQMVRDAPDQPSHHQVLAQSRLADKDYQGAIEALEAGMATTRLQGPREYLLDQQTRISMLAQLTDTYSLLAAAANPDIEKRDAMLAQSAEALARYRAMDGADTKFHQARADYLAGRAAFIGGNVQNAITYLEQANRAYENTDAQTVVLLAKAYEANSYFGEAAKFYEQFLAMEPRARNERLSLVQIYIRLGGSSLERANAHINDFIRYNPEDIGARILRARVLAKAENYAGAAEVVRQLDLEANPQLTGTYAQYLAQAGQTEEAIDAVRARLRDEVNDASALAVLFNLVTDQEQRAAELERLVADGLAEQTASRYRVIIENNGRLDPDEWAEMQRAGGTSELLINKQLFLTYAQTNQEAKMRETLALLVAEAPDDAQVLAWRYGLAMIDKDFSEADRLIARIMSLPASDRPGIAAGNGAFLRAQLLANRILADTPTGETPDLREAVRAYRRALEENPSYAAGWLELGRLFRVQNDPQRARDALNRAYQIQPTNIQAAVQLANVMQSLGETDRALDLYRGAVAQQPNNRALMEQYLQLEWSAGVRRLAFEQREAMRVRMPNDTTNRQALAMMLAEESRYEEALSEVAEIEQIAGVSLGTVQARASIYGMSGDAETGAGILEAYIDGRGDEATEQDYLTLGNFLARYGMNERVETAYQQAVAIEDPETRLASRQWASWLGVTKRYGESARLFRELIAQFPEDSALKFSLARVFVAMKTYDEALAALGPAPASPEKEHLRAQIELQRGDIEAALAISRGALETYEGNSALRTMEARTLTQLGDRDLANGEPERGRSRLTEAKAIYEEMVERNSSLYELRVLIARIDDALGNREAALDRLIRVLDDQPTVVSARTSLFEIYIRQAMDFPVGEQQRQQLSGSAYAVIAPLAETETENLEIQRFAARAAAESRQFPVAAGHYERALAISSETRDLFGLVSSLLSNSQPREAIVLLDNPDYARLLSESIELRALHARALAATGRSDDARNLFRSLLTRAAGGDELSLVLDQLGTSTLKNEVVAIVESALGDDLPPEIDFKLAQIEMGNGDYEAVIQRLSRYETAGTGDPQLDNNLRSQLALSYHFAGGQDNLLKAKALYQSLLELPINRNNLSMLNNFAYLLTDGLVGPAYARQAVEYAQRAADLIGNQGTDLQRAQIIDTLGWAHFRAQNYAEAIRTLERSVELYPLSTNNMHLGQVYMHQGNDDLAMLHFDDARRATSDPAELEEINGYIEEIRNRP